MTGVPALELRDIHLPPHPAFWPPAPGWWVVAVLGALAMILGARLALRRYRLWRRRRALLRRVAEARLAFEAHADASRLAADLSELLRRVALGRFARHEVAGLAGKDWLRFLDHQGGAQRFSKGPGAVLVTAPYAPRAEFDVDAVCALVGDWLGRNG